MDINKPITRAEAILSGEDLEPMSRIEYFLKKAANGGGGGGGGSDLPEYTSGDIGKVLGVVEDEEHSTTATIVPEQSVTISEGQGTLQSFDNIEFAVEGASAIISVNGNTRTVVGEVIPGVPGGPVFFNDNDAGIGIAVIHQYSSVGVIAAEDGTYTVSLTMEIPEPKVEWTDVITGIQIVEPLTADNAPAPPEGYTPENYYVNVIVNSDDTALQLQDVAITIDDSTPGLIPTFMSAPNIAITPVVAVKNPSVFSPIENDPAGNIYKLTIKESTSGAIGVTQMGGKSASVMYIFNASNLEWVKTGIK